MDLTERLAGYTLVGFHVKGYPVTDELLTPFAGHKNMVNFGVENGALTDACFPVFAAMPKLRYLILDGNAGINGSGLAALQGGKLDLLTLNRTGLDDAGLLQAASIPIKGIVDGNHYVGRSIGCVQASHVRRHNLFCPVIFILFLALRIYANQFSSYSGL